MQIKVENINGIRATKSTLILDLNLNKYEVKELLCELMADQGDTEVLKLVKEIIAENTGDPVVYERT